MRLLIFLLCLTKTVTYQFPDSDDAPQIAMLDFKKKMMIFNPDNGTIIKEFDLIGGKRGASACIDYDYRKGLFYYGDAYTNDVYRLKAEDGSQSVVVQTNGGSPEGLAYDWIHDNLYVTLLDKNQIIVVKPNSGVSKVLIRVTQPVDIEVDPTAGWLYYTSRQSETGELMRCGLDGQNQEALGTDMDNPRSISLDYTENKIYWTNVYPGQINKMNTKGTEQEPFNYTGYGDHYYPKSITVSEKYVYWNSFVFERMLRRPKHMGTDNVRYRSLEHYTRWRSQTDFFTALIVLDPERQRNGSSLCGNYNGGCSHFCLPKPIDLHTTPTFTCHCPDGMVLSEDNMTCIL